MKNKLLKIIGLLIIFVILLIPARYVNSMIGYTGFLFFVLLLGISILYLFILERKVEIVSEIENETCIRGEKRRTGLAVRNRSMLVAQKATAELFLTDVFGNVDEHHQIAFSIGGHCRSDFGFVSSMDHVGVFHLGLKDLYIYDMFDLFRKKAGLETETEITVLPKIYSITELEEVLAADNTDNEGGVFTAGGMDYIGVREYEKGDSMKQIHWKLSARSGDYLTKLTESSRESSYSLILDTSAPEGYSGEELMDLYDTLIEVSLSVGEYLTSEDVEWMLFFLNREHEVAKQSDFQGDYLNLIRNMDTIHVDIHDDYPNGERILEEEARSGMRSSNLMVFTCNPSAEMIQELIQTKRQLKNPELFFVIPERLNSREREKKLMPLGAFDEMGIPYHILTTKINRTGFLENETLY